MDNIVKELTSEFNDKEINEQVTDIILESLDSNTSLSNVCRGENTNLKEMIEILEALGMDLSDMDNSDLDQMENIQQLMSQAYQEGLQIAQNVTETSSILTKEFEQLSDVINKNNGIVIPEAKDRIVELENKVESLEKLVLSLTNSDNTKQNEKVESNYNIYI